MYRALFTLTWMAIMSAPAPARLPDFDSLWNYADPQATEQRFRTLLPAAEASGDRGYHAELLTQIARALGLQREFDSAHHVLDVVEKGLPELGPRPRVRYLLERGRAFNSSDRRAEAGPLFQEAWELARANDLEFHEVDAAHMLAIVAPAGEQMAWNLKALETALASDDAKTRGWVGSLQNNIGWTYFDQKKYDSALTMFESALQFRRSQGREEEIRIARWCVAKVQRHLGRVDEALRTQRAILASIEEAGAEADGFVFEEIAECLWAQEKRDEARTYFQKAHEHLSRDPWLKAHEPDRLERLRRLGEKP